MCWFPRTVPGSASSWRRRCGPRVAVRSSGESSPSLSVRGAGLQFTWGQLGSFVTPHDSDQVSGSSFLVAMEDQLFHATMKVPNPGSCFWNGMF